MFSLRPWSSQTILSGRESQRAISSYAHGFIGKSGRRTEFPGNYSTYSTITEQSIGCFVSRSLRCHFYAPGSDSWAVLRSRTTRVVEIPPTPLPWRSPRRCRWQRYSGDSEKPAPAPRAGISPTPSHPPASQSIKRERSASYQRRGRLADGREFLTEGRRLPSRRNARSQMDSVTMSAGCWRPRHHSEYLRRGAPTVCGRRNAMHEACRSRCWRIR